MSKKYKSSELIKKEEIANTISHAIGIAIAITVLVILVVYGAIYGTVWHVVCFSIFGACMITVYTASTLFHGTKKLRLKYKLNRFDHSAIYLLIAGTYTPIALVALHHNRIGWFLFGLIWLLAMAGVVFKIWFYQSKWTKLSTLLYVLMGWLIVIAIVPIIKNVPNISLWFLLAGALSYSVGVFFFLYHKVPFFHFIFHLFILGGSICHFFAFLFLIPIS